MSLVLSHYKIFQLQLQQLQTMEDRNLFLIKIKTEFIQKEKRLFVIYKDPR